uniref:C-type lectin domain-containing protein n=1 Tax=Oryzias latipes TaxID=8090 RepID=A0A3P9HM49_ORYLA
MKLLLLFFLNRDIFIWVCLSLAELRCPGLDWLEFGEFCYKPFGDRKTWQDAQRVCRDLGAELVSIMSMKEQSWVETTNNLWTGLNDLLVPGMFTWSDDFEVTFTYWAPGEPNNHNGFSEDCVEMLYETGRWNDKSCSELNNYICKKPKAHYPAPSVQPTQYGCPQVGEVKCCEIFVSLKIKTLGELF